MSETTETLPSGPARLAWKLADWNRLTPSLNVWARQGIPHGYNLAPDDVEEIVARVVVRAWMQTTVPDDPAAWTRTVARNLVRDSRKGPAGRTVAFSVIGMTGDEHEHATARADAILDEMDYRQRVGRLRHAIRRLPDPMRRVVVLFDLYGKNHEQIADALGINVGTSKMRLLRGRRLLTALYFDEPLPPLKENGTPFQRRGAVAVRTWRQLQEDQAKSRAAEVRDFRVVAKATGSVHAVGAR